MAFSTGTKSRRLQNLELVHSYMSTRLSLDAPLPRIPISSLVCLGDRSWIAGRDSQFGTHGIGVSDRAIVIAQDNYAGSAVRFIPGSAIGNPTLAGLGCIVTRQFCGECPMIANVPAKSIKENYCYRDYDSNILHTNNAGTISG